MAKSSDSSKSWQLMVLSAFIGALFTGITQYIFIGKQNNLSKESVKVEIIRNYLEKEIEDRSQRYRSILQKLNVAINSENTEDILLAKNALESDLPFFEARFETQAIIQLTAKELLQIILENNRTPASDLEKNQLLIQLRRDFQNDINRLKGMLFNLNSKDGPKEEDLISPVIF